MPGGKLLERLRGRREQALLALGAFLLVLLVLVFVDPRTARLAPVCPLHYATGLHCPGCGTGRALHALVHGDVVRALRMNALAVAAIPVFLVLTIRAVLRPERPLPFPPPLAAVPSLRAPRVPPRREEPPVRALRGLGAAVDRGAGAHASRLRLGGRLPAPVIRAATFGPLRAGAFRGARGPR